MADSLRNGSSSKYCCLPLFQFDCGTEAVANNWCSNQHTLKLPFRQNDFFNWRSTVCPLSKVCKSYQCLDLEQTVAPIASFSIYTFLLHLTWKSWNSNCGRKKLCTTFIATNSLKLDKTAYSYLLKISQHHYCVTFLDNNRAQIRKALLLDLRCKFCPVNTNKLVKTKEVRKLHI